MTPHAVFGASAVGMSVFLPSVVSMMAHPGVISLLSWWYPILCTVTLLHESGGQKPGADGTGGNNDKENEEPASAAAEKGTPHRDKHQKQRTPLGSKTPQTSGFFPMTTPKADRKKKRQSMGEILSVVTSTESTLEEELDYWLRFWMVRGTALAIKALFGYFVPRSFSIICQNLEFFFYMWIYALPFIVPQTIGGQVLPEARPLPVMVAYLSPSARFLHDQVASLVPAQTWNNTVVATASRFLDLAVFMRLLSQGTADWLVHVLHESRPLILPSFTMFMPGMITQYGAIYVQFVPMISRSTHGQNRELFLKYWVLNAIFGAALQTFSSILWWIPFSSHVSFLTWCYLCIPHSIERWYGSLHEELSDFGLLPGSESAKDFSSTKVGQLCNILLDVVPKGVDNGAVTPVNTATNVKSAETSGEGDENRAPDDIPKGAGENAQKETFDESKTTVVEKPKTRRKTRNSSRQTEGYAPSADTDDSGRKPSVTTRRRRTTRQDDSSSSPESEESGKTPSYTRATRTSAARTRRRRGTP